MAQTGPPLLLPAELLPPPELLPSAALVDASVVPLLLPAELLPPPLLLASVVAEVPAELSPLALVAVVLELPAPVDASVAVPLAEAEFELLPESSPQPAIASATSRAGARCARVQRRWCMRRA